MQKKNNDSVLQKIIIILVGGLLTGLLWRARGTHGWGSESGILMVGFVYVLFITAALGARKKMDFGWMAFTVSSFVLTTPAWGTLLTQMTGTLNASATVDNEILTADISVFSGVFMMFCLGFGTLTLFGVLLGRAYSDKQWKIRDFIILIAVFYIVDVLTKATVSHGIIELVQPQAADLFEQGLEKAGIEGSAYKVYMQHFASIPWSKKIHGGRNYFSEVQVISNAIKAVVSLLVVRFAIKDKIAAKVGAVACLAFGVGITVADLFFVFTHGGFHNSMPVYTGSFIYAWSNWEYFTGFIGGAVLTAFLLHLPKTEDVPEITFDCIPEKIRKVLVFIGGYGIIAVNIVRPAILRFDTTTTTTIVGAVIGVVLAAVVIALLVKFAGFNAQKVDMQTLSRVLLLFFVTFITVFYLFVCTEEYRNINEINSLHTILFVISAILCLAWSTKEAVKKNT